jgi:hypothetical protein
LDAATQIYMREKDEILAQHPGATGLALTAVDGKPAVMVLFERPEDVPPPGSTRSSLPVVYRVSGRFVGPRPVD